MKQAMIIGGSVLVVWGGLGLVWAWAILPDSAQNALSNIPDPPIGNWPAVIAGGALIFFGMR